MVRLKWNILLEINISQKKCGGNNPSNVSFTLPKSDPLIHFICMCPGCVWQHLLNAANLVPSFRWACLLYSLLAIDFYHSEGLWVFTHLIGRHTVPPFHFLCHADKTAGVRRRQGRGGEEGK